MTETLQQKAERLAALEDQAVDLGEQIHALKGEILAAATPGDVLAVGGQPRWKVTPGRRTFSERIAAATLPTSIVQQAIETKISGPKVKHISPALWESCCTQGDPMLVTVRR